MFFCISPSCYIYLYYLRGHYAESFVYFSHLVSSCLYHACDQVFFKIIIIIITIIVQIMPLYWELCRTYTIYLVCFSNICNLKTDAPWTLANVSQALQTVTIIITTKMSAHLPFQDIYSVCVLHLSVLQFCDIFTDILCSWVCTN